MKAITYILLLLPFIANSQSSGFEFSASLGYGNIEGHSGHSVDGEFVLPVSKKLRLGLYYNNITSNKQTEPISDLTLNLITRGTFERQAEDYLGNVQRSQNSLGVIATFGVFNAGRINFNIGGGLNYNILDSTINQLNADSTITYYKWHDKGLGYHFSSSFLYCINRQISLGIKSRLLHFKDFNSAVMVGTQIRLYQE